MYRLDECLIAGLMFVCLPIWLPLYLLGRFVFLPLCDYFGVE